MFLNIIITIYWHIGVGPGHFALKNSYYFFSWVFPSQAKDSLQRFFKSQIPKSYIQTQSTNVHRVHRIILLSQIKIISLGLFWICPYIYLIYPRKSSAKYDPGVQLKDSSFPWLQHATQLHEIQWQKCISMSTYMTSTFKLEYDTGIVQGVMR